MAPDLLAHWKREHHWTLLSFATAATCGLNALDVCSLEERHGVERTPCCAIQLARPDLSVVTNTKPGVSHGVVSPR